LSFNFTATDGDGDTTANPGVLTLSTEKLNIVGSVNHDTVNNNALHHGLGSDDIFKWNLVDHTGIKSGLVDHITDFKTNGSHETLDIRDVTQGNTGDQYLQLGKVGDSLALFVSHNGGLATGESGTHADVTIVFDDYKGTAAKDALAQDLGGAASDAELLSKLLASHHGNTVT
jgi:hypothetical protein